MLEKIVDQGLCAIIANPSLKKKIAILEEICRASEKGKGYFMTILERLPAEQRSSLFLPLVESCESLLIKLRKIKNGNTQEPILKITRQVQAERLRGSCADRYADKFR